MIEEFFCVDFNAKKIDLCIICLLLMEIVHPIKLMQENDIFV